MQPSVIFHTRVQRDMDDILRFYRSEAGEGVANRFFDSFVRTVDKSLQNPNFFHPVSGLLRRAPVQGFPFHFLYRKIPDGIRILVLRHDSRHPSYGLRRK